MRIVQYDDKWCVQVYGSAFSSKFDYWVTIHYGESEVECEAWAKKNGRY